MGRRRWRNQNRRRRSKKVLESLNDDDNDDGNDWLISADIQYFPLLLFSALIIRNFKYSLV